MKVTNRLKLFNFIPGSRLLVRREWTGLLHACPKGLTLNRYLRALMLDLRLFPASWVYRPHRRLMTPSPWQTITTQGLPFQVSWASRRDLLRKWETTKQSKKSKGKLLELCVRVKQKLASVRKRSKLQRLIHRLAPSERGRLQSRKFN